MPNVKKVLSTAFLAFALALFFSPTAFSQQDSGDAPRRSSQKKTRNDSWPERPNDFAQENLNRVAASASQIRIVLVKDQGLMVELKRWVAKEATDNGQLVEDSALTDDAIFERLEQDVTFRSVATRLAQRYGYLLPSINPESDAAKEQDLILKERARRLVQIEAQEDSQALQPKPQEERVSCDPKKDPDCERATSNPSRGRRRKAAPEELDETEPGLRLSPEDQTPPVTIPQLLRADASRRREQDQDSVGGFGGAGSESDLLLASNPARRAQDAMGGSGSLPGPLTGADGLAALAGGVGGLEGLSPLLGRSSEDTGVLSEKMRKQAVRLNGERTLPMEKELAPVAMVHKANPYSDIPSLYDLYVQASPKSKTLDRFGLDVFRNGIEELDQIPMDVPASPDYVVGPGDGLSINMWGGVSQRFSRTVDREGRINLPQAGPLLVSGRTLGDVQQSAQQLLRTMYRDVSVDVSLSRLRTVRVYVVGDVAEPGAYDISALSTPLNALFEAGGVTPAGSLRKLKHYRGNQLLEEVDAYDLLLHGVHGDLRRLENGDTLMVPPIGPQVTVDGMVRRPAIYELHDEATLDDALELSGGILPAAALQHIEVQRIEAHEKHTMLSVDVSPNSDADSVTAQLAAFKIQDGDQIHVFPIAPYNEKAIYLQGHVVRPGRYSYRDGMKLTDLIHSYSELLPEPAGRYAEIVRLNAPDFHPSVESFDLSAALANPAAAPALQPLDTVRIFSRFDFEQAPSVWVGGAVRTPGDYRTSGQARLRDAVYLAGGVLPDASLNSAQLFRTEADGTMKILSVNLGQALAGDPLADILLQPRDRLLIHRNTNQIDPASVYVKGEVAKPGRYPLTGNMHVEDLVRAAGGLKRSADPDIADLTSRTEPDNSQPLTKSIDVKLASALGGEPKDNLPLRDGDVLTIRQKPGWQDIGAMVTVKGEVRHPGTYGIKPGERLSSVLLRSGGFDPQAYPYGALLTRREVRDLEMTSHVELVQRIRAEQVSLKALPESDADQRNAKLTAIAETDTVLSELQAAPPVGRVVVHIKPDINKWRNTAADVPVRDGDVLLIPKKADYVTVTGQVYNATAVSYQPGRSAKWYLSQAGGFTPVADKASIFVIRADGSVIAAKNNNGGLFAGNPLSAELRPGDSIVVPEKAPKIGGRNWQLLMQSAQMASSVALAVAYIHP
jgi:protein involved in polysaccharide export with SLBB domain